jgi:hypothetical protein
MGLHNTQRTGHHISGNEREVYAERYYKRLKATRRTYIHEKIKENERGSNGLSEIWLWFKMDVKYILNSISESYKKWSSTKEVIRSAYGLSGISQFFRMLYVVFIQRNVPKHYYTMLLFKDENWNRRSTFAYRISIVQYDLVRESFPFEIDLIRDKFQLYEYCKPFPRKGRS